MRKFTALLIITCLFAASFAVAADHDPGQHHQNGQGGQQAQGTVQGPAAAALGAHVGPAGPSAQLNAPGLNTQMQAPHLGSVPDTFGGVHVQGQQDNHFQSHDRSQFNTHGPEHLTSPGFSSNGHVGDHGFDRNGIGSMDEHQHQHEHGNDWRYQRHGNDWFYWSNNRWVYFLNGAWVNYDPNTYVVTSPVVVNPPTASFVTSPTNGPYYEDANGFYMFQNGVRVYDPSIARQSVSGGP